MPDVKEVFRMATESVRPEPGARDRQLRAQRERAARRRTEAVGLVAGLAVIATLIAVHILREAEGPRPTPAGQTGAPDATIRLAGEPRGIVDANGVLWVATYEGLVYKINPATNQILDRIAVPVHVCGDLVAEGGSIYVSGCGFYPPDQTVVIDARTDEVVDRWTFVSPVFGGGRAWAFDAGAPNGADGVEIDPASGKIIDRLQSPPIGYAFGSLWFVTTGADGEPWIERVDPDTGIELGSYALPAGSRATAAHGANGGFVVEGGYVWIVVYGPGPGTGGLYRIDPRGGTIERVIPIMVDENTYGPGPGIFLDASDGTVWVAEAPDTVVGVDARTAEILDTLPAKGGFGGWTNVEVANGAVWITNPADDTVWRYDLPRPT